MQPKRDPNDRRYWPLREGGTGAGFSKVKERTQHPQSFAVLKSGHSMDIEKKGRTAEGIRTRSRLILELALDRLEGKLDEASVKELNGAIAALGRIAGVASQDVNITGSVAHLHLDALRHNGAKSLNVNTLDSVEPVDVHTLDSGKVLDSGEEGDTVKG